MPDYRQGNHQPHNVYRIVDPDNHLLDICIAHVCNPDDAELIVRALNILAEDVD